MLVVTSFANFSAHLESPTKARQGLGTHDEKRTNQIAGCSGNPERKSIPAALAQGSVDIALVYGQVSHEPRPIGTGTLGNLPHNVVVELPRFCHQQVMHGLVLALIMSCHGDPCRML